MRQAMDLGAQGPRPRTLPIPRPLTDPARHLPTAPAALLLMPAKRCEHCPDMKHRAKGPLIETMGPDGFLHLVRDRYPAPPAFAAICGRLLAR